MAGRILFHAYFALMLQKQMQVYIQGKLGGQDKWFQLVKSFQILAQMSYVQHIHTAFLQCQFSENCFQISTEYFFLNRYFKEEKKFITIEQNNSYYFQKENLLTNKQHLGYHVRHNTTFCWNLNAMHAWHQCQDFC